MKRPNFLMRCLPVFVTLLVVPVVQSQAQIVLDFRSQSPMGRDFLGEDLDFLANNVGEGQPRVNPVQADQDGITVVSFATSTLTTTETDEDGMEQTVFAAPYNSQGNFSRDNQGGIGVDSGLSGGFNAGGDFAGASIDPGEELTFTLEFADDLPSSLFLTSIDLSDVSNSTVPFIEQFDANSDDAATITIGDNDPITVFNGVESDEFTFDGSDIFTPNTPIEITSGDTINFSNLSPNSGTRRNYSVESITLTTEVAAVPEPSSLTLLSLGGMWMMVRRKRS